jgi:nitrogen fixation protein NifU and related proteins
VYASPVLRHFRSPHNVGQADPSDGVGEVSNGSVIISMSVHLRGGVVAQAFFRATTCVVTVAACSALAEMVEAMPVEAALAITPKQLAEALGAVPGNRMDRCALAVEALRRALAQALEYGIETNGSGATE